MNGLFSLKVHFHLFQLDEGEPQVLDFLREHLCRTLGKSGTFKVVGLRGDASPQASNVVLQSPSSAAADTNDALIGLRGLQ